MNTSIVPNVISFQAKKPEHLKIDREKTVAILGASKETNINRPYIKMAQDLANDLAKRGYNVVTGGGHGTMEAANKGAWAADPSKSFAINVTEWVKHHKNKIFNVLGEVKTGAERTDLFRNIAKYWVVFPGGPGSMQELSVGGESKYYKSNPSPEMILVGRDFHKPLFDYLKNMNRYQVASNADQIYELADSKEEILNIITGSKLNLTA